MMTHSITEEKLDGAYGARIREYADGNDTVLDLCREEVWVGIVRGGRGLLHSVGAPFFVDNDDTDDSDLMVILLLLLMAIVFAVDDVVIMKMMMVRMMSLFMLW